MTPIIPPKTDWKKLSIMELYDVKSNLLSLYFNMRSMNAGFADQYKKFISELDELISQREAEREVQD